MARLDGTRWGLACKFAYETGRAIEGAIWKGAKQVSRANVDAGIVAVQLVNVFPHERMNVSARGIWTDALTRQEVEARLKDLLVETSGAIWDRLKRTERRTRRWVPRQAKAMLFVAQTIAVMDGASYVVGTCHYISFGPMQQRAVGFAEAFQRSLEKLSSQR